jgi:hypothetical protein
VNNVARETALLETALLRQLGKEGLFVVNFPTDRLISSLLSSELDVITI